MNKNISDIIFLYLTDSIDDSEKRILDEWLTFPENKILFDRICDRYIILKKTERFDTYDKVRSWKSLEKKIKPVKKLNVKKYLYIAASFLLPVGITLFFLLNSENIPEISMTQIEPGKNHAIMYSALGEEINLDNTFESKKLRGDNITLNKIDGILYYQVEEGKKVETTNYNKIITPLGSEYTIVLPDGTKVWLNAGSSLIFPEVFGDKREIMISGEVYLEVARDENRPFYVETDKSVIQVLGTEFNVRNYDGETNETTLITGSISLTTDEDHVILKPGQQAILSDSEIKVREVDINPIISWKDGLFFFDNKSFGIYFK